MAKFSTKDIQEQLTSIGLTEYEVKVYLQLIKTDKIGATNLAKSASVSRGRIYDVLDNLIIKGFCKILPGATKSYKAVAPEVAIDNTINEMKKEMLLKEMSLLETSKSLQNVFDSTNENDSPAEHVQILTSQSAIKERIKQLQFECQSVLRVFVKEPIIMDNSQKDFDDRRNDQIKKNLKMKQIYEYNEIRYKEYANSIFKIRKTGADYDVRVSMKLPLKLAIYDGNHALFTLNRERTSKKNYSMMSVSYNYLTLAMIELFEFYWDLAVPLEEFIKSYPIEN